MTDHSYYCPSAPRWFSAIGGRYWSPDGHHRMSWGELSTRSLPPGAALSVCLFEESCSLHLKVWRLSAYVRLCPPWREPVDVCESWGFSYGNRALHLDWGRDRGKILWAPWDWEHVRHDVLLADGTWEPVADWGERQLQDARLWRETYPYVYQLESGEQQWANATVTVEEREWRWRWLSRLPWPRRVRRSIDVDFDTEIGERAGSWKGGVLGTGHEMRPDETARECLRRMMRERRFR